MITTVEEWAVNHARTFGMTSDDDLAALAGWGRTFLAAGHPLCDLAEATEWMVVNVTPNFRREHLDAIRRRLASTRAARISAAKAEQKRTGFGPMVCRLCDDKGLICVPHRRFVADGMWDGKYTCAIACGCQKGEEIRAVWDDSGGRAMGLNEYERHVPNWRELMEQKRRTQRALCEHESSASVADDQKGRLIVLRLANAMAINGTRE